VLTVKALIHIVGIVQSVSLRRPTANLINACLQVVRNFIAKEAEIMASIRPPKHPGEVLIEKFLDPLGITQLSLSKDLNIPIRRVHEICRGKRGLTPETALRLAIYFQMSPEFWLLLQQRYELEILQQKDSVRLKREVRPFWDRQRD
jgi:addiction module HigA family antidote